MRKPGQRRIDHGARKHEAEWRAYQASWVTPISELRCTAEAFHDLRRYVLGLNRMQTGRLLRVSVNSVLNWEHGVYPVPFSAYLALLLISQSEHYRLAGETWRDFELRQRFNADPRAPRKERGYVVELVDRATGAAFTVDDLRRYASGMQPAADLESAKAALQAKVDELMAENAKLRKSARLDELQDLRARMAALLAPSEAER